MTALVQTPPVTQTELAGYAKTADLAGPVFVSPNIMTVADVLNTYPAGASYRGKYVRVSDLYGYVDGVMRCGYDGTQYYWQPTSTDYGRDLAVTADMTITPHGHPTSFNLTGSIGLGVTRGITLSPTNGWPGAIKEFKNGLSSLLGGLNILGTGLGSAVAIPLGGYKKFYLDNSGGTLVWRQLV